MTGKKSKYTYKYTNILLYMSQFIHFYILLVLVNAQSRANITAIQFWKTTTSKHPLGLLAIISHSHFQSSAANDLLSISTVLSFSNISYKWNHTIYSLMCLALSLSIRVLFHICISTLFPFIAE